MTKFDWVLDERKFLSRREVGRLLRIARWRAENTKTPCRNAAVRDYFIVNLALSTGLRVMEIARLKCGDVFVEDRTALLIVRNGKGGKKRLVRFSQTFKQHYQEYVRWKQAVGEPTGPDKPLLLSSNTGRQMTIRAIQKAFKRTAVRAGLALHYSIHCLRHTYACELYRVSGYNLRLVQKQLGPSSSRTTEVYADVMDNDIRRALEKLYADSR